MPISNKEVLLVLGDVPETELVLYANFKAVRVVRLERNIFNIVVDRHSLERDETKRLQGIRKDLMFKLDGGMSLGLVKGVVSTKHDWSPLQEILKDTPWKVV